VPPWVGMGLKAKEKPPEDQRENAIFVKIKST
jgi:hypothetical protein